MIVDRSLYDDALPTNQQGDIRVFVLAAPGADLHVLRAELTDLVRPYLVVSVRDGAEFAAAVDTLVNLLDVLLPFTFIVDPRNHQHRRALEGLSSGGNEQRCFAAPEFGSLSPLWSTE